MLEREGTHITGSKNYSPECIKKKTNSIVYQIEPIVVPDLNLNPSPEIYVRGSIVGLVKI